jgi:hypothetical protein
VVGIPLVSLASISAHSESIWNRKLILDLYVNPFPEKTQQTVKNKKSFLAISFSDQFRFLKKHSGENR